MRQGFLRSSRYSPGNMDRESLEALFVGREDVMEDVLSRVADSIGQPQKHYILLIGPRGSGKTHFLMLAYHRILEQIRSAGLEDDIAIALLNEEEWGVASYLDLLVRILRALAEQTPDLNPGIEQVYERFSRDSADAEAFAASLIAEHTRGKTLLLLCENLVDLFHGLGDEGQKRWRAAIQQSGNWSIIATTPALFAGLQLQDRPFYGFFTIRHLKSINADEGLELLHRKAVHEDQQELAAFLRTPLGRARVRAIHHLAAGNHRAYVVLFDFLDKESLDDLVGPFMHMVDDLTPYYQDRMRQLPPAQRKIVEFLSLESTPTLIKDTAAACLMSHQTASKQIGELAAAGFVDRIPAGRYTYCELSEPLMRICIEVKDNKTQHFRLFVAFLRHWFSTRELERRLAALPHDHDAPGLDRVAESQPDNREHWRERTLLQIDAGDFDEAAESAARVESLYPGSLSARLLAVQVAAGTDPLDGAFALLDADTCLDSDILDTGVSVEGFSAILSVSLRAFGPRYLHQGILALRNLPADLLEEGIVGNVLTSFLFHNLNAFTGSLDEWDDCLDRLAGMLADEPSTLIPLEMLNAAVRYAKTSDKNHLLRLPLEQRQLLERNVPRLP